MMLKRLQREFKALSQVQLVPLCVDAHVYADDLTLMANDPEAMQVVPPASRT